MRITVTEEHIRKGKQAVSCECPIALAIKSAINKGVAVSTCWVYFVIGQGKRPKSAILPEEAQEFITSFDHGRPVQPFSFDLPLDESTAHPQVDESH